MPASFAAANMFALPDKLPASNPIAEFIGLSAGADSGVEIRGKTKQRQRIEYPLDAQA